MAMKIWHQSFTVLGNLPAYEARLRKHIDGIVRPDTEVVLHGMHPKTYETEYPGHDLRHNLLFALHANQFVLGGLAAQEQGFDAYAISTIPDPMVLEIRSAQPGPRSQERLFQLHGDLRGRRLGQKTVRGYIHIENGTLRIGQTATLTDHHELRIRLRREQLQARVTTIHHASDDRRRTCQIICRVGRGGELGALVTIKRPSTHRSQCIGRGARPVEEYASRESDVLQQSVQKDGLKLGEIALDSVQAIHQIPETQFEGVY